MAPYPLPNRKGVPIARKGWDQLSTNYRNRLANKGISRQDYETGAPIRAAAGHKPAPTAPGQRPVSEKRYEELKRQSRNLNWPPGSSGPDMVNQALAEGMSPDWIRRRLADRLAWTAQYKGPKQAGPGRDAFVQGRIPYETRMVNGKRKRIVNAWYWYH